MAAALLFTACAEDKGTSTEVTYANDDERVDSNHLNQYNLPGTAGRSTASVTTGGIANNAGSQSGVMQTEQSAVELVFDYYNRNKPEEYYSFSATNRMAGMTSDTAAKATGGKVTSKDNRNPGGDPGNKSNTAITTTSTTADMQQSGSSVGDQNKKSTTKKTEQKKERLTPYNDRKN